MIWLTTLGQKFSDLPDFFVDRWKSISLLAGVALLSAILVQDPFRSSVPRYQPGEVARKNVRTTEAIRMLDEDYNKKKQTSAESGVLEVYDSDATALKTKLQLIDRAFRQLDRGGAMATTSQRKAFENALEIHLSDDQWKVLAAGRTRTKVYAGLQKAFSLRSGYWLLDESSQPQKEDIIVRDVLSGEETRVSRRSYLKKTMTTHDLGELLADSKRFVLPGSASGTDSTAVRSTLVGLATALLEPDFVLNSQETSARQKEARENVEPAWIEIGAGEVVVHEGERVNREAALVLQGMAQGRQGNLNFWTTLKLALLMIFLVWLFYGIGRRNFRKFKLSFRDQWVTGTFFVTALAFISLAYHLMYAARGQSEISFALVYIIPFGFAGMLLRLFTSMEITTFFAILFSSCVTWFMRDSYMGLLTLVVSLAGAARMRHIAQRLDVLRAGLVTGLIQAALAVVALGLNLTDIAQPTLFQFAAVLGCAILSGLAASALILGVQPLLEYLGYTTDLRLMELSNTNHPLLREMIMKAPGTYFHSFTVSQLAEKAAEAIHGNQLFARVSSLYHDIGKIKKPHYFIENIKGENKHDKLVPTMSALIISNHVKDGIELGYQYKLPQSIIEIIPQHHGTSLISYFYEKAKKLALPEEEVDDHDFRYAGPKPQTREGAIILLADAAEATAKALQNKSQDSLKQAVHQTIQRFFLDGQLDECDLSLKDLTAIGNAFVQVLQGVYHQRIDYPHLKKDRDQKSANGHSEKDKDIPSFVGPGALVATKGEGSASSN